ncbi:MAG: tetratricopeptide repeat protein [Paracoccaceae bacterium]
MVLDHDPPNGHHIPRRQARGFDRHRRPEWALFQNGRSAFNWPGGHAAGRCPAHGFGNGFCLRNAGQEQSRYSGNRHICRSLQDAVEFTLGHNFLQIYCLVFRLPVRFARIAQPTMLILGWLVSGVLKSGLNFMNLDEVHLGDIRFDPTTRALTFKDGRRAQLRNKSKEVLLFLVKNPSRTVTKNELIEAIWSDVAVSDESLVQCIADTPRLIGKDARQIVETVPREGYRMHLGVEGASRRRSFRLPVIAVAIALVSVWVFWSIWPVVTQPSALPAIVQARATLPGTSNTPAYLEVLQGRISANRFNSDESLIAERHFRRAIELDPNYARAHAELGTLFAVRFENDWTVLQDEDKEKALYYADRAVALDPELGLAHYALGRLHSVFANFEAAEAHLLRAMALQPENEDARAYYGVVLNLQGDTERALEILEPAVASHPNPPYWYYLSLGAALLNSGQYEAAELALEKCLELATKSPYCLRYQIALYGETGRIADAQAAARDYASSGFDPSVGSIMNLMKENHPDIRAGLERAFRSAELPK